MSDMDQRNSRSESAAAVETAPVRQPGKFPLKWVIAGIVAFLVIGGTAAYALFGNLSPKQQYLLSEIKTFQKAAEDFEEQNGELTEFQEKIAEQASSTNTKVSMGLETDGVVPPDFEMFMDLLNEAAVTAVTEQDPKNNTSFTEAGIEVGGESLLDMEVYQSPKMVAARVPDIYDKYFYLNADEYGQFMRQLDPMYDGPEKLSFEPLTIEDLELTEEEEKHVQDTYADFLNKELKDEFFTKKDNVSYEHNGEKINVTQLTMKMNEKETKTFINNVLDQLIQDEKLQDIIAKRAVKVANSGASQMDMLNPETVKDDIKEGLKEAKTGFKDAKIPEGVTSVLMVKDQLVIDREMKISAGSSDEADTIAIHTMDFSYDNGNKQDQEFKVEIIPGDGSEAAEILVTNKIARKDKSRTEDLKAELISKMEDAEEAVSFTMKSEFEGENPAKQKITRDFSLGTEGESTGSPVAVEGTIVQNQDVSVKDKYNNQLFEIELSGGDDMAQGTISLKIDTKTKLKEKADIPKVNTGDEVNVNNITPEQMSDIQMKAGAKLQDILLQLGVI
ncbi:hypothetical protein [Metabacillus sp. 84]|uniref:hypothetical protein n=1 Tax=Metabacillus sp. 84 TaxID=3404705 RepID=UPI003CF1F188